VLNDFNLSVFDCLLTDPTWLCASGLPLSIIARDHHLVGIFKLGAASDGVNLSVKINLVRFTNIPGIFCLERVGLEIRILPNAENVATLVVNDGSNFVALAH